MRTKKLKLNKQTIAALNTKVLEQIKAGYQQAETNDICASPLCMTYSFCDPDCRDFQVHM